MNINELTIGQAKELSAMFGGGEMTANVKKNDFEVGKSYFIRTVTHHFLGKVIEVLEQCLVVEACVWVADSGRYHKFLIGEWSDLSERETYPKDKRIQLFIPAFIDAMEWTEEIPTESK